MTQKPQVFRRQYLVERGFQLRYTLLLSLVGAVASGVFGLMVLVLQRNMRADLPLTQELLSAFSETDTTLTWLIVALTVLMAGALGVFGLLLTHRVAGPVFVMNHYVQALSKGRFPRVRPLRKHDELQTLFETFGTALDSLRQRETQEAELLDTVVSAFGPLSQSPEAQKLLAQLGAVRDRKREAVA